MVHLLKVEMISLHDLKIQILSQHQTSYLKSTDPNQFTFEITDLKEFNAAYQTKYYYRLSKPYDDSNDVTIKLVNGETNSVVETKQINSPGTVSIGENSLERAVAGRDPQKLNMAILILLFKR